MKQLATTLLLFLTFSCSIHKINNNSPYPPFEYDKVIIYNFGEYVENEKNEALIGKSYIDREGNILTDLNYKVELSSVQKDKLQKILISRKPPNTIYSSLCSPDYRDAILWFKDSKIVAKLDICFHCGETNFTPKADGMLILTEEKRYKNLSLFFMELDNLSHYSRDWSEFKK